MKNRTGIRILIFYIPALLISNLFRFDVLGWSAKISELPAWISILSLVLLEGSGVFVGALIAIHLMKKRKGSIISLFGTSKIKSLLMFAIPVIAVTIAGINNSYGLNPGLYGFIAAAGTFIYCIFEEYGWRGYLQDELSGWSSLKRYLLIGGLWYFWHLSFLSTTSLQDNLMFFGILVLASWGIGQLAIATHSILACAGFHFIINILAFNQLIKNGFEGNAKWIVTGAVLLLMILLLSRWRKTENSKSLSPKT